MKKVIDYRIVHSASGYRDLEAIVNEHLLAGWQPLGGITYGKMPPLFEGDEETMIWIQALVFYEE